ncbi:MAG: sialate O-acetylesterase [Planctomycetes bacterium]|nr:sialate O-acetylesterase [Planctomycetota bacterium]
MTCFRFPSLLLLSTVAIIALLPPTLAWAEDAKPVKVFILAGQSNMQGHSPISMGKDGDLDYAAEQEQFAYLKQDGQWAERDDVWYYHKDGKDVVTRSNLKPGLGANAGVGPELAFGHVMGDYYDEQVLLIKCAWGGQAIGMTFRPPSSGLPEDATLQAMFEGAKKKNPDLTMDEFEQIFGMRYRQVLAQVKDVLENLKENFPAYEDQGYEIAGFFWHQGWNDGCNREFTLEYEKNMTNFIRDMRKDLGNVDLPFVIATSGMGGPDATGVAGGLGKNIEPAQMAAAAKYDHCVGVPTRHFQRHQPGRQKSHWYNSAESYCLVGDAAGKAMVEILKGGASDASQ